MVGNHFSWAQQLESKMFNLKCDAKPERDLLNNRMYNAIWESFHYCNNYGDINCSSLKQRLSTKYKYACFVC